MVLTSEKPQPKTRLPMLILHGCPRCMGGNSRGDLAFSEEDKLYHCIQCGYIDWGKRKIGSLTIE